MFIAALRALAGSARGVPYKSSAKQRQSGVLRMKISGKVRKLLVHSVWRMHPKASALATQPAAR